MKLIVGLGNPGDEYINTRHNIGFMFLDYICKEKFTLNKKLNALEFSYVYNNEKIVFIKPLSFMNLSGSVVLNYCNFYKVDIKDIMVIQDDLDLPLASYKVMYNRGDGGHNGIKDIIKSLSSKEFYRLKIGISKDKDVNTKDYVLSKFSKNELSKIYNSFEKLNDFIDDFILLKSDSFIQKYNTKVDD